MIPQTLQNTLSVPFTFRLQFSGHCQDLLQADVAAGLPEILHSRRGLGVPHLHQHGPDGSQVSRCSHPGMVQPRQELCVGGIHTGPRAVHPRPLSSSVLDIGAPLSQVPSGPNASGPGTEETDFL